MLRWSGFIYGHPCPWAEVLGLRLGQLCGLGLAPHLLLGEDFSDQNPWNYQVPRCEVLTSIFPKPWLLDFLNHLLPQVLTTGYQGHTVELGLKVSTRLVVGTYEVPRGYREYWTFREACSEHWGVRTGGGNGQMWPTSARKAREEGSSRL